MCLISLKLSILYTNGGCIITFFCFSSFFMRLCLFARPQWWRSSLWLQPPESVILWLLQPPHSKPDTGAGTGRQQPIPRGRSYQRIQFKHWYTWFNVISFIFVSRTQCLTLVDLQDTKRTAAVVRHFILYKITAYFNKMFSHLSHTKMVPLQMHKLSFSLSSIQKKSTSVRDIARPHRTQKQKMLTLFSISPVSNNWLFPPPGVAWIILCLHSCIKLQFASFRI